MELLEKFLENGIIEFGNILNKEKCNKIYSQILETRNWSQDLFRSEKEVKENPNLNSSKLEKRL